MPKDKKSEKKSAGAKSSRTQPKSGAAKKKTPATPKDPTLGSYGPVGKRR